MQVCRLSPFDICDALRDLVPLAQFKKREKHSWRSATFSKATCLPNRVKHLIYSSCFTEDILDWGILDNKFFIGKITHSFQMQEYY